MITTLQEPFGRVSITARARFDRPAGWGRSISTAWEPATAAGAFTDFFFINEILGTLLLLFNSPKLEFEGAIYLWVR
jgi:hypothetical protein